MRLGQILIQRNVIDLDQLEAAREQCKRGGGTLNDALVALEFVSAEELDAILGETPPAPDSVEETGLDAQFLLSFVLKAMYVTGHETAEATAGFVELQEMVVQDILALAKEKRLVEVLGLADSQRSTYRYALTDAGRAWAVDALEQCHYAGPAPVPIESYREQVAKQSIGRDRIAPDAMERALAHLVLPAGMVELLGPAANAGKSILLYGAPGNGKTSIAEALGAAFGECIYVPHAIEVGGQIIRIFDPAVHEASPAWEEGLEADGRWVRCRRPVVVTGGELTLEMLDLSFDEVSKSYEAPAHVKATGGVFIVDDFGRQRVRPLELVNRWIMPLDRHVDYLTLHTGKKVELPFDELVVFSTNFPPGELMDPAGLRRIPYKFHIAEPAPEEFEAIFGRVCEAHGLIRGEGVLEYLLGRFYPETGTPISGAHPRFIVDHVLQHCRFHGTQPRLSVELVRDAVANLLTDGAPPSVRPFPNP